MGTIVKINNMQRICYQVLFALIVGVLWLSQYTDKVRKERFKDVWTQVKVVKITVQPSTHTYKMFGKQAELVRSADNFVEYKISLPNLSDKRYKSILEDQMLNQLNAGGVLEVKYTVNKQNNEVKVCTSCIRVTVD
ncbi:TPA: hypothetical protein JLG91_002203 [Escherichia coli]|nr:hypothetical protein [Escherichia coli]